MTRWSASLNPSKVIFISFLAQSSFCPPTSFRLGSETIQSIWNFNLQSFSWAPVRLTPFQTTQRLTPLEIAQKKLLAALLSPWQKLNAYKCFLFPALQFVMHGSIQESWSSPAMQLTRRRGSLFLQNNGSDYILRPHKSGCVGLPISAEEVRQTKGGLAFPLLTSSDDMISSLALKSEVLCLRESEEDASGEDLSGLHVWEPCRDEDDRPPSNPLANIWTVARVASRRLKKIEWSSLRHAPPLKFQDLVLKTSSPAKKFYSQLGTAFDRTVLWRDF
ncbi:hypothetical protein AVEN_11178-1 [Araneus ventricosus]|uniref:Uncharacterized protein n=1 Tax=Araneus ventricosus TaxID=182803 RepID=A0A4Y2TCD3_ARAVE|nr:hypothetical protein AVEN_11178-1 [Araneus ventricosus]